MRILDDIECSCGNKYSLWYLNDPRNVQPLCTFLFICTDTLVCGHTAVYFIQIWMEAEMETILFDGQ